ncbi:MAG: phage major tail protein, TP901-1 family [Kordiimonadaceae bacterium]|nr:phage major tail protein, TP901-1 family [Kordiimonadaceae bacterium]
MAAKSGRDLLVKIYSGSGDISDAGSYNVVGGFKSNGIDISGEAVDITSKDSGGFKEQLESAGNLSIAVKGSGVFVDDASFKLVHEHMLNQTHPLCLVEVVGFASYMGSFTVSSLSLTGDDGDAISYDISLDSAGVITVTYP